MTIRSTNLRIFLQHDDGSLEEIQANLITLRVRYNQPHLDNEMTLQARHHSSSIVKGRLADIGARIGLHPIGPFWAAEAIAGACEAEQRQRQSDAERALQYMSLGVLPEPDAAARALEAVVVDDLDEPAERDLADVLWEGIYHHEQRQANVDHWPAQTTPAEDVPEEERRTGDWHLLNNPKKWLCRQCGEYHRYGTRKCIPTPIRKTDLTKAQNALPGSGKVPISDAEAEHLSDRLRDAGETVYNPDHIPDEGPFDQEVKLQIGEWFDWLNREGGPFDG